MKLKVWEVTSQSHYCQGTATRQNIEILNFKPANCLLMSVGMGVGSVGPCPNPLDFHTWNKYSR